MLSLIRTVRLTNTKCIFTAARCQDPIELRVCLRDLQREVGAAVSTPGRIPRPAPGPSNSTSRMPHLPFFRVERRATPGQENGCASQARHVNSPCNSVCDVCCARSDPAEAVSAKHRQHSSRASDTKFGICPIDARRQAVIFRRTGTHVRAIPAAWPGTRP